MSDHAAGAQLSIIMYTAAMPASSSHATGVPGSCDRHAYAYAALMFFSGLVHTWAHANTSAIMAEVRRRGARARACAGVRPGLQAAWAFGAAVPCLLYACYCAVPALRLHVVLQHSGPGNAGLLHPVLKATSVRGADRAGEAAQQRVCAGPLHRGRAGRDAGAAGRHPGGALLRV